MNGLPRQVLFLLAAAEIGLALGLAPGMTPGRAVAVATSLCVASAATLALMELSATDFRRLTTVVAAVAFAIGPLAGSVAAGSSDPTQARASDLDLQVSCSVSADQQTITAQVSFVWHRVDLAIPGTNTGPGYDVVGVYPQALVEQQSSLDIPYPNPPLVNLSWQTPYPWSQDGPWDLSVDGRPDGGFGRSALVYDGRDLVPSFVVNDGEYLLDLASSTLEAGRTYSALWRFTYHPDVSALPADQLILIADYGHARRFVAQAFAECGSSPKPHPQRSETFVQY
ncbi:MAG TPA: hypothetical protein VIK06_01840 [Candidatus Limnocylindrales bacterium]